MIKIYKARDGFQPGETAYLDKHRFTEAVGVTEAFQIEQWLSHIEDFGEKGPPEGILWYVVESVILRCEHVRLEIDDTTGRVTEIGWL